MTPQRELYNILKKYAVLALVALALLLSFQRGHFSRAALARERDPDHILSYTQADLVALLQRELGGDSENGGMSPPQGLSGWSDDLQLLERVEEEDGCVHYVAFDGDNLQLILLSVNESGQQHITQLLVERKHAMEADVRIYPLPATQAEGAAEPTEPTDPTEPMEPTEATDPIEPMESTETTDATESMEPEASEQEAQGSGEDQDENRAETPEISVTEELGEPNEPGEPVEETEDSLPRGEVEYSDDFPEREEDTAPTDDGEGLAIGEVFRVTTGSIGGIAAGRIESGQNEGDSYPNGEEPIFDEPEPEAAPAQAMDNLPISVMHVEDVTDGVYLLLEPGEYGVIALHTGLLYGGPLGGNPRARAALNPAALTAGTGNILRIYSAADLHYGVDYGTDYATFAAAENMANTYYSLSADTILTINRGSGGNYAIEMHNTQPVTIKSIDASALTAENETLSIFGAVGITDSGDRTLNLIGGVNGIKTSDQLDLGASSNRLTINIESSDTGILGTGASTTLSLPSNLTLNIESQSYGINAVEHFTHTSGTVINVDAPNPIRLTGALNCWGGELTATSTATNPAGLYYGIVAKAVWLEASAQLTVTANYPITVETAILVGGRSQVNAISSASNSAVGSYGVSAKNIGVTDESSLRTSGSSATGIGILVEEELYAAGKSLVSSEGHAVGIQTKDMIAIGGEASYATIADADKTTRTRIVGKGVDVGIECMASGGIFLGTGSLIWGTGDSFGVNAPRLYHHKMNANYNTGRMGDLDSVDSTKRFGTLIAEGLESDSVGFYMPANTEVTFDYPGRIIAVGGTYGFHLEHSNATNVFMLTNGFELVAHGGLFGFFSSSSNPNRIFARHGGKLYARGGRFGVRNVSGSLSADRAANSITEPDFVNYDNSRVIGIGGVADDNMDQSTQLKADLGDRTKLSAVSFDFFDLPEPVPGEDGLLPVVQGTYGISVGGSADAYVVCYDRTSVVKGFGGEYGISSKSPGGSESGGKIWSCEGGYMEGRGGNYGIYSAADVWLYSERFYSGSTSVTGGDSVMKGYGKTHGITSLGGSISSAGSADGALDCGQGYLYGYGESNGLRASSTLILSPGTTFVAETIADPTTFVGYPGKLPAVVKGSTTPIDIQSNANGVARLHEIYRVKNAPIYNGMATQFHSAVLKMNLMGNNPETPLKLNWTTPENGPSLSPDGRDWMDYDADDDRKLVKPGQIGSAKELLAFGYALGVTLVGDSGATTVADLMTGATGGKMSGDGSYRITFKGVEVEDTRTMNVKLEFKEKLLANLYSLYPLPDTLSFELKFEPDATYSSQKIIVKNGDPISRVDGTALLTKLRRGIYTLTPKVQYGFPYQNLPPIQFQVAANSQWDPGSFSGYEDYNDKWYLELKLLGDDDPQTPAAMTDGGSAIVDSSGTGTPSFTPHKPAYQNVTALRKGSLDIYYQRILYDGAEGLNLLLQDAESEEVLPGKFQLDVTRGGQPVPGLNSKTVESRDESGVTVWDPEPIYAGLEYELTQQLTGLTHASGTYQFRPDYSAATGGYVLTELNANPLYTGTAANTSPHYSVLVENDMPQVSIPLAIHAVDEATQGNYSDYLKGGGFKLTVTYQNDVTADITDTALEYNSATGLFTMKLKGNRKSYTLEQTKAPKAFAKRTHTNTFRLDMTTPSDYEINTHSSSGADNGWAIAGSSPQRRVDITNESAIGNLTVNVNAKGLWAGHDDALFRVVVTGTSGNGTGKTYAGYVAIPGGTDFTTYKDHIESRSITFSNLWVGDYTVTVHPAMRTTTAAPANVTVAPRATASESFSFEVNNEKNLSGGAVIRSQYTINFSGT